MAEREGQVADDRSFGCAYSDAFDRFAQDDSVVGLGRDEQTASVRMQVLRLRIATRDALLRMTVSLRCEISHLEAVPRLELEGAHGGGAGDLAIGGGVELDVDAAVLDCVEYVGCGHAGFEVAGAAEGYGARESAVETWTVPGPSMEPGLALPYWPAAGAVKAAVLKKVRDGAGASDGLACNAVGAQG